MPGHLLDEAWGAEFGFPGIVPSSEADYVEGYVLTSDGLRERWAMLDAFEGKEYQRALVQVYLANEESVEAYVYAIAEPNR